MARVEVRQVRRWNPVHRLNDMLRDRLNALMRRRQGLGMCWRSSVCLRTTGYAGSGEGPAGGVAVSASGLTDHIWTWEEFLTLSIPKGVIIVLPDIMI